MGKCLVLAVAVLALLGGCTRPNPVPVVQGQHHAVQQQQSTHKGQWIFRHKVTLSLPRQAMQQSFDGMMRFDPAARTLHIVGLGAFGLVLFEVHITQETLVVSALHPSLTAIPKVVEHIAQSVRHIWLECPRPLQQQCSEEASHFCTISEQTLQGWPVYVEYKDMQYQYVVTVRLLQADVESE